MTETSISEPSTTNNGFAPIQAATLVDSVYATIRQAILSNKLRAGDAVRESVLATQMELSRAPVREAMRRLEQAGLVTKAPNRSYYVTKFSDRDIYELATVRAALETLGAQQAMRTPEKLEEALREQLDAIAKAAANGDERAIMDADRTFHEALVKTADNRRLSVQYATLRDQIDLCLCTHLPKPAAFSDYAYRSHEVIFQAVVERDVPTLVERIDQHIREGAGVPEEPISGQKW